MRKIFTELLIETNKHKKVTEYKPGDTIFYENDPCECVSVIVKGAINMYSIFNDKEVKFNYMKKNYIFGHNLIFNKNNLYKGHIVAAEKTKIMHLSKQEFLKSLQNPTILESYLNFLSDVTLEDKEQIKVLKILKVEDKINYLLLINHGTFKFKNITHFASMIGTSREYLSRSLSKLEELNIITRTKNIIRLKK